MIRVCVVGAAGRMGRTVCRAVVGDPELSLVAGVDPAAAGRDLGEVAGLGDVGVSILAAVSDLSELSDPLPDVAVDFSLADAVMDNLRFCAQHGLHAVVGTTGLGHDDIISLRDVFSSSRANCLVAPNFAVGAVLMMHFAEIASRHMQSAEIVELHHEGKVDAPSGTSLATARRMVASRVDAGKPPFPGDRTTTMVRDGARGSAEDNVRVHSVRLPGLVAHQEVIFGSAGETLTIRHDSLDRVSFMPGVLLAVKEVGRLEGLTVGIEPLLGL